MKKGFTLIELLAVIVILAIIALVTIPMINNVIEKAKKGALEDSVYGLKSAAELYYSTTGTSETIEFNCTKEGCKTDDGKKLPFKGTVNLGRVKLFSDGKVSICIEDSGYASHMMVKDKKVTTTTGSCNYSEEEYAITELVSANEYKKVVEENNKIKNALKEKTIISSINNSSDTIISEIESLDLNQGEAANKKEIVEGLKYSGLGVTEDMSWSEIKTVLSKYFPETINILTDYTASNWIASGSTSFSHNASSLSFNCTTASYKSNSGYRTLGPIYLTKGTTFKFVGSYSFTATGAGYGNSKTGNITLQISKDSSTWTNLKAQSNTSGSVLSYTGDFSGSYVIPENGNYYLRLTSNVSFGDGNGNTSLSYTAGVKFTEFKIS